MMDASWVTFAKHFKRRSPVVEFTASEILGRRTWTGFDINELATQKIAPDEIITEEKGHVNALKLAVSEAAPLDLPIFGIQQRWNLIVKFDVGKLNVLEVYEAIVSNGLQYSFVDFAICIRLPQKSTYLGPFPLQKMRYVFGIFVFFIWWVGVEREAHSLLGCNTINGLSLDHCSADMLKIRISPIIIVISSPNSSQNIHGLAAIPSLCVGYNRFKRGYTRDLVVRLFVVGKQLYAFNQQVRKTGIIVDLVLACLLFYLAIRFLASPDNRSKGDRGYSHCAERREHSCPQSHRFNVDRVLAIPSKNPAGGEECAEYGDPNQYIGSIEPTRVRACVWLDLLSHLNDPQFRMRAFSSDAYRRASGIQPVARLQPVRPSNDEHKTWSIMHRASPGPDRWRLRSRTYPGIASAMADQWGGAALSIAAALSDVLEVAS